MNRYKYNGKELEQKFGLEWYDYGARNYDPAIGRWMNIDPMAEKRYSNNTNMYCNNNPVIFTYPDGMLANIGDDGVKTGANGAMEDTGEDGTVGSWGDGEDDWIKKGNAYIWVDSATDEKSAEEAGGKYVGKSGVVNTLDGNGQVEDSVKLNADGTVTKNGETLGVNSNLSFGNIYGSGFYPRPTEGQFVGISANFAFGGGVGFSFWVVNDAVGNSSYYGTFNVNIGLTLGIGLDFGNTTPTDGNQFLVSDFKGEGSTYNVGFSTPFGGAGWSTGGSVDPNWSSNDKMNPNKIGRNDGGYRVNQSTLAPPGLDAGASYTLGKTIIW